MDASLDLRASSRSVWAHSLICCFISITIHSSIHSSCFVSHYSPILYSIAGLGIAIVNDFKSIEGDRAMGLQSLPVAFGVDTAKWICAGSVTLTQLGVAGFLYTWDEPVYAAVLLALILPQMYFQYNLLLPDPIKNDVKYQASAQPFLVFGILATALCVGHHDFSV
jgi:chlorophyll synthase